MYRLRRVQLFDAMSPEIIAYKGTLVHLSAGGKVRVVATTSNNGSGGSDRIDWKGQGARRAFEAAALAACPNEPVGWAAEWFMGELLRSVIRAAMDDQ